jgi:uncharacterized membrane protein YcaP (DUF421 family)
MDFLKLGVPAVELVIRCTVIYLVLLLGLRLFGKRTVGQFTLFDLVFLLLVANAVQPAMTGPDNSLTGGLIIIVVLILLNFAISYLRVRVAFIGRIVEPPPAVVVKDGVWQTNVLKNEGVTNEEVLEALREHGVDSVKQVKAVTLEPDGSLSVVTKDDAVVQQHRRRHVRFVRHG